jgi:hypothetical protein
MLPGNYWLICIEPISAATLSPMSGTIRQEPTP